LACSLGPTPDTPFDRWPPGKIRNRTATVRASPPPKTPGVIDHAPVIVESLHSEVMFSLDPTCPTEQRDTRIRVQLDAGGQSPPFYVCFSDIGGQDVSLTYRSGLLNLDSQAKHLQVDPEPRLLRISSLFSTMNVDTIATPVAEITAWDANVQLVEMQVDVMSTDLSVLAPEKSTVLLSSSPDSPTLLQGYALAPGTATLSVSPRLLDSPVCQATPIEVVSGL